MVTSYLIQPLVFASLSSVLMTCYFSQFLPPLAALQNNNKQKTKTDNLFHQTNSKKKNSSLLNLEHEKWVFICLLWEKHNFDQTHEWISCYNFSRVY